MKYLFLTLTLFTFNAIGSERYTCTFTDGSGKNDLEIRNDKLILYTYGKTREFDKLSESYWNDGGPDKIDAKMIDYGYMGFPMDFTHYFRFNKNDKTAMYNIYQTKTDRHVQQFKYYCR